MKYLKEYKLFESILDIDLKEVEEAFYNVSDKGFDVEVLRTKLRYGFGKRRKNDSILVIIDKSFGPIDLNKIKEELDFAINYITNELKLELDRIYIETDCDNLPAEYATGIDPNEYEVNNVPFYKSIENLISDNGSRFWGPMKLYFI